MTVDAYPQKDGHIVEGLTPDDFEILEDGKVQKSETFDFVRVEPALMDSARRDPNSVGEANALAADPRNRVFVTYLDVYHVDVTGSHDIRKPLVDTLNRLLAPNDLFGVMTPKMRPRDITFGRKLESIEDQLARNWPWGERFATANEPEIDALQLCLSTVPPEALRAVLWELRQRRREDITLTNLDDLVGYLSGLREARTSVVLVTDGWILYGPDSGIVGLASAGGPTLPGVYVGPGGQMTANAGPGRDVASCKNELMRLGSLDDTRRFRDLVTLASRSNITFYPVNPGGLAVFDQPINAPDAQVISLTSDANRLRNRVDSLRTLAENTDGIAVVGTNDLAAGMRRISDDVSAYYLLGYYSTNTKNNGGYRKIQVRMKKPGLTVKARRGYVAPSDATSRAAAAAPAVPAGPSPVDDALAALGRLQSSSEVFTYGAVGPSDLAIVAEIASARVEGGKWGAGADVEAVVTGPNGEAVGTVTGKIEPATRGALLHVPLAAGATGPWRVNIKVSAAGERLEDRTTIEAVKTGPLLGNAIVSRAAPGPRAPLRPVADFQFRRTERVHIEWTILKALDQRQARLLAKNGQPLPIAVAVTERDVNGQNTLAADVNLAPLGPGDYVIEVTAGAGAETERRLVAIRVVQ